MKTGPLSTQLCGCEWRPVAASLEARASVGGGREPATGATTTRRGTEVRTDDVDSYEFIQIESSQIQSSHAQSKSVKYSRMMSTK
jgi:hypothetical protein